MPEALAVREKARAFWEEKRSIGYGSTIYDYFDEWGRSPSNLSFSARKSDKFRLVAFQLNPPLRNKSTTVDEIAAR